VPNQHRTRTLKIGGDVISFDMIHISIFLSKVISFACTYMMIYMYADISEPFLVFLLLIAMVSGNMSNTTLDL
jgi:hypothetical protein